VAGNCYSRFESNRFLHVVPDDYFTAGDTETMKRILGFIAMSALAALAVGCTSTTDNSNVATVSNSNNSNVIRVVNNNGNENTAGVSTMNGNANTRVNANLTREEYERNKARYESEAKSSGRSIGTGIDDAWIWTKARVSLAAVDDLRDSTINVDVNNGVVTLTGTVANAAQKAKAEATVKSISGVKSVKNELKISPSGNTNTNTANHNLNANKKG
jgi:hyperosmotically inducible protein